MTGQNRFFHSRAKCSDIIPNQHSCNFLQEAAVRLSLQSPCVCVCVWAYLLGDGPGAEDDDDDRKGLEADS